MSEGLISIIMPVHNAGAFVRHAIQSVFDQTYPNWELLVIDDGSADDSIEQINQFSDQRIIFFKQDHKGVSAARNVGLAHMKGQYFCFLDADDVLPPKSLEARLGEFAEAIGFVDGAVDTFDHVMQSKLDRWIPRAEGEIATKLFRLSSACFFGLTWMVKRQAHLRYRFDESLRHCEDLLFFMSIADSGRYAFTKETVLCYRKSPKSAMSDIAGLANGYTALRSRVRELFPARLSFFDKFTYEYKVRKIIFLSFFRRSEYRQATSYLAYGRLCV